ncbi:hypothetical protein ARSEF4850_008988 [Beauveria asiatica]
MTVTKSHASSSLSMASISGQETFDRSVIEISSDDEDDSNNNTSTSSKLGANQSIKPKETAKTAIGPQLRDCGHREDVDSTRRYGHIDGDPVGKGDSDASEVDLVVANDQPRAHIRRHLFAGQTNSELSRQQLDDEIPDSEEDSDDGERLADANADTENNKAGELCTEGKRDGPRGRIAHSKRQASIESSEQNVSSAENRRKRPRYSVTTAFFIQPNLLEDDSPDLKDDIKEL